jgi:glutamine synthetase
VAVEKETIGLFKHYKVLSKRELEARYEVFTEQYSVKINIEAETAASIARTLLLPAASATCRSCARRASSELVEETEELVGKFVDFDQLALEKVNAAHPDVEGIEHAALHARRGRAGDGRRPRVADRLERIVADDLWPLPKYSEMLFIK